MTAADQPDSSDRQLQGELQYLLSSVGENVADDYYELTYTFLADLGLPGFVGSVPLEIWAGVAQAFADASGYTVLLRGDVIESTDGPNIYRTVEQRDVAKCSPMFFVKTLPRTAG